MTKIVFFRSGGVFYGTARALRAGIIAYTVLLFYTI